MFEAVKMLNRQQASNPTVHGKEEKPLLNTQDIYNETNEHFEHHLYDKSNQTIDTFKGEKRPLNLPISLVEVEIAIKKSNNNRASGLDEIAAELVKYAPVKLWEVINSVLNECFKEHERIDDGKGAIALIQNPGKPRGSLKNLPPVILLQIV